MKSLACIGKLETVPIPSDAFAEAGFMPELHMPISEGMLKPGNMFGPKPMFMEFVKPSPLPPATVGLESIVRDFSH